MAEKRTLTPEEKAKKRLQRYEMDAKRKHILELPKNARDKWDMEIAALGVKNITLDIIETYSELFGGEGHKKFMAKMLKESMKITITGEGKTRTIIPSKARKAFVEEYLPAIKKENEKKIVEKLYNKYAEYMNEETEKEEDKAEVSQE